MHLVIKFTYICRYHETIHANVFVWVKTQNSFETIEGSGLFGTDSKINFFFRFFAVTRDQIN